MTAKKFFYVLLGLIVLSFAGVAGAYTWGSSMLDEKSIEVSNLKADQDISEESIIKLRKAQSDSEDLEKVVEILDRLLPQQKQQEKLIADIIYTSTSEAGIPFDKVSSFSFEGTAEPDSLSGTSISPEVSGVYQYPFQMEINGISYETLIKFLNEVETNGRIVQVSNINIVPISNSTDLSVQLSMKAYLKP